MKEFKANLAGQDIYLSWAAWTHRTPNTCTDLTALGQQAGLMCSSHLSGSCGHLVAWAAQHLGMGRLPVARRKGLTGLRQKARNQTCKPLSPATSSLVLQNALVLSQLALKVHLEHRPRKERRKLSPWQRVGLSSSKQTWNILTEGGSSRQSYASPAWERTFPTTQLPSATLGWSWARRLLGEQGSMDRTMAPQLNIVGLAWKAAEF